MLILLIPLYRVDTFYTPGSKDEMTFVKFDKMKVAQIVNQSEERPEHSYKSRLISLLWEHQPFLVSVRIFKDLVFSKKKSDGNNQQYYIFNNTDEFRLIGYNLIVLWGMSLAFISWE